MIVDRLKEHHGFSLHRQSLEVSTYPILNITTGMLLNNKTYNVSI